MPGRRQDLLHQLRPYAPELNPGEGIWPVLRRTTTANRVLRHPARPPRRETCQLRWRHPTHHPRRARLTRRLAAVRLDAWGIPYGTVAYTYGTSPLVSNSRPSQDRPRRGRSTYSARTVWSGPRHAQPPQAGSLPAGSP
ncbi:protein of unknown function [Streptomyces murinus]